MTSGVPDMLDIECSGAEPEMRQGQMYAEDGSFSRCNVKRRSQLERLNDSSEEENDDAPVIGGRGEEEKDDAPVIGGRGEAERDT